FCAMCGHDWCSVRISKEIVEFASGKAEGYQRERVLKSPGLTPEQRAILEQRGRLDPAEVHELAAQTKSAVAADRDKAACHSDHTAPDDARKIQEEKLIQLSTK
ncbi:MAG: thiamine biosynthesis protein ThiC, partial [Myxococcota bacterium]